MHDESESDAPEDESNTNESPSKTQKSTPTVGMKMKGMNLGTRKSPTPSREKHGRQHPDINKNNKTFWSSGVENSINPPKSHETLSINKDARGPSPFRGGIEPTEAEKKAHFQKNYKEYLS